MNTLQELFGIQMNFYFRLREERERLGLNQVDFGAIGGVKKLAQINYEKGEREPDATYLAAIAMAGVDVLYLLTGKRGTEVPPADALPPKHKALLNNYELCNADAQKQLDQLAALLAAGLPGPEPKSGVHVQQKKSLFSIAIGSAGKK